MIAPAQERNNDEEKYNYKTQNQRLHKNHVLFLLYDNFLQGCMDLRYQVLLRSQTYSVWN